ncbi:CotY/CotZ family spore coat protein [Paenisporosarcina sp. TG20]|uniref:CotY/CotZ family spore coat protein n=1 Tax=Paenisporosarcina sp. TG20 TaxID=1211706 RepID=UPI0002DF8024|nr:CotY/CotZ family spore coat protein [Paenisporosarcina sp. TG20]
MNEEQNKMKADCVCDVYSILKTIYETQSKANLSIFKGVLPETIPFILYSIETMNPCIASGIAPSLQSSFSTSFFRIEKLTNSSVYLMLLLPSDVEGNYKEPPSIPYRLKKTNSKVIISLKNICGIQCINPKLVNRQVIISGKEK